MRAQQVALVLARRRLAGSSLSARRTFFSFLRRSKPQTAEPLATLSQDDLFHPLSQSPFAPLREKAERVKKSSICPVSNDRHGEKLHPAFDCPDCGWPTHASQERWQEGRAEHDEYCGRLREVNEDEHDVRSGRRMKEFDDMPGEQPYEAAVSFASWDTFFFTRNFPSIDTDRAIRHVSKVLTYPITVAGILHQNGPFTSGNGRVTREGRRSMAAIHSILHLPPGSSAETAPIKPQPPFRIFLPGARAESTLPPHLWQQLTYLFPRNNFNIYFIGPEVGLPIFDKNSPHRRQGYEFSEQGWGVPSYTASITPQLNLTSMRASYEDVHSQFGPFDPYTDVFFAFSPGLGFPDQAPPERQASVEDSAEANTSTDALPDQPLVQAQTSWKKPLQQILGTKCALFFTAFSPLDLQRDVSALYGTAPPAVKNGPLEFPGSVRLPSHPIGRIKGVTNEFDLILTPGKNTFSSEKWEIAEWDVRVGVKTNWGVWGIRGRRYEVVEGQE